MEFSLLLVKYDDCYALLNKKDIESGKGYMADPNGIYEVPEVDGFIGFLNVVACSKKKGDLPMIDESKLFIPKSMQDDTFWLARVDVDDLGFPKITNGYVNLIGIQIPKQK